MLRWLLVTIYLVGVLWFVIKYQSVDSDDKHSYYYRLGYILVAVFWPIVWIKVNLEGIIRIIKRD